jgi:small subunit ribosomal protein S1
MSWTQHVKHPSKIVGIGDIVEAVVLKVNKEAQKISLGLKQLEPDPWENVDVEFPVGSIVKGKVRNIAVFGAFVELKEGVDGLLHISDMSWTRKVNHPGELFRKGDSVDVKILNVDREKRRISVGLKQLSEDPWAGLASDYAVGTELECEIARLLDRGMVVALSEELEGFIPLNQLGERVNHPSDIYQPGDKIPAKVIEFDLEGRRIVLSIADYFSDKDAGAWEEHRNRFPVKGQEPAKEQPQAEQASAPEAEESAEEPAAEQPSEEQDRKSAE